MKPSPFTYHAPTSLAEALAVLAEVGHDGKILAGGQSLVPMLSMRLAAPAHLVDINRLSELAYVRVDDDVVRVGALARHADLERDGSAAAAQPLLRQALVHVAHPVIRNRGTVVGSIAHADPSGELPAVLVLLDGEVEVASSSGRRVIAAHDLFLGPLEPALRPDELIVEARFPRAGPRVGSAFVEIARRHGDYAVCGVAAVVELGADGQMIKARTAYVSMGGTPACIELTETLAQVDHAGAGWEAVNDLVRGQLLPDGDIHATADFRRHLSVVLTRKAVMSAAGNARSAVAA